MNDAYCRSRVKNAQSGNVFFIILIGVILFAALAFVLSRGMKSDTTITISQRQAELLAVDILSYAQRLERGVNKLRVKGLSENDIDFTNDFVTGYEHTPVQPDTSRVFSKSGGGVSWRNPPEGANDGSPWLFTGEVCIPGIGEGGTGCDTDNVSNEEILAVLPKLKLAVCEELNKRLTIQIMPVSGPSSFTAGQFDGSFSDNSSPANVDRLSSACVKVGTDYSFYHVLLAR